MRYFRITYKLLSAVLLLAVGGCVNDDYDCPEGSGSSETESGVVMQFTMVTRAPGNATRSGDNTRAVVMPAATEIGFPDENYLDISNLKFFLFDNSGILLENFYPQVEAEPGTNYVKYTAKFMVTNKYFTESATENISFSIMVIANTANAPGNAYYGGIYQTNLDFKGVSYTRGMTLAECFTKDPVASFAMPRSVGWAGYWKPNFTGNDYTDDKGGYASFNNEKAYIPMAGLQSFSVSKVSLDASTYDNPCQLSAAADGSKDINMLRALAKIEVVDKINAWQDEKGIWHQPSRDDRTYIDKAELMGYVSRGSLLPSDLSAWNIKGIAETQYCKTPSIPTNAGATYMEAKPISEDELTILSGASVSFFADAEATARRGDGCRVFSCYLTEYDYSMAAGKEPMWIRCTLTNPMDQNGDALGGGKGKASSVVKDSPMYRIWVRPYDADGNPSGYTNILRNNIYRYEVTDIRQTIGIKWTVCNMDEATVNIPTFN